MEPSELERSSIGPRTTSASPRLIACILISAIGLPAVARGQQPDAPQPGGPQAANSPRPELRHATSHYDIRVQGTDEEATAFGLVLEAAWPTFRQFFHGEPALKEGERLAIRVFDTQEACLVGAMNDKADMPPLKYPAWFSPGNGVVYLYRYGGGWFTRYRVLYRA